MSKVVQDRMTKGQPSPENYFLLVEHPHVYTLGKSGNPGNMLISPDFLKSIGATFYQINRGGDITYHGPGQVVGYPIIDLDYYKVGIRDFIWKMEQAIIDTLSEFGLKGERNTGATGVWLDAEDPVQNRKICAIGVRITHHVSMHGFALNVNTDLKFFQHINPCGFSSSAVTSIQKETGIGVNPGEVKTILKEKFNRWY